MLLLDVSNMKAHTEELKKDIDQYEKYALSIAKEIKDSELEWQDDNSARFFDAISTQKRDIERLISELNDTKKRYNNIVDEAHRIASDMNKIFVNQSLKTLILTRYDNAISSLNAIKDSLNSQYMYFCTYYESSTVYSIAYEMGRAANKLRSSKNEVERLLNKLNTLEINIKESLTKITVKVLPRVEVSSFMS